MIVMQPSNKIQVERDETIPRLKREEMSQQIVGEHDDDYIIQYSGQRNPKMPELPGSSLSADLKTHQDVSRKRADENDFAFFEDVISSDLCPEYNGYNTKMCRDQGHSLKSKTTVAYLPLIDRPPADTSTMMTAMLKAKRISRSIGQEYVVFTADQQLYRVALHATWENPARFSNIYLRLGGMHLLMSYCGCIGTPMAETGLAEILSVPFGGVLKMLTGKKYPQNVRAFRILVEELLRPLYTKHQMNCMDDLQQVLNDASRKSRTAKLWIDCLIRPGLLIMKFIRAERESDWPLHLDAVREMMPLFFAARHTHYARYALYYLGTMENMPEDVSRHFKNGEHTMHHNAGLFNGIWTDMAIETTFMRHGHGRSGIIGITLKPETLKTWAYSLHTCNGIERDLDDMRTDEKQPEQTHHKEEMNSRIKADAKDRHVLRDKLELCIDPLDADQHPSDGLVNIDSGRIVANPLVNVDNAVYLGSQQLQAFEKSWPAGFHDTIPKLVHTMALPLKHIEVGDTKVFDTEVIYARAMGLQASSGDIDTNNLLAHELSPYPTSMFNEKGHMREAKTKSRLKKSLHEESSTSLAAEDIDASFLDGCAVLWVVTWPLHTRSGLLLIINKTHSVMVVSNL